MWIWTFLSLISGSATLVLNDCHESFYNLPSCINKPDGYFCSCGSGFKWNSRSCIAAGVDSKMLFTSINTSYTITRHQSMPKDFSISLWIRPQSAGILLSMIPDGAHFNNESAILISLKPYRYDIYKAIFQYRDVTKEVTHTITGNRWTHVIWTQKVLDETYLKWVFYINEKYDEAIVISKAMTLRGSFILGQLNTTHKNKFGNIGYSGDLAHVNIWNTSISVGDMREIHMDCIYAYCGNVVQWAHFRYGTHGNILLKWPSRIKVVPCIDTTQLIKSCDSACSLRIGAQCKTEIKYNYEWLRAKANTTFSVTCPMPKELFLVRENATMIVDRRPRMTRSCLDGKWEEPNYDGCMSDEWHKLVAKKRELEEQANKCHLTNVGLIEGLQLFVNVTESVKIVSAIEISISIRVLDTLVFLKEKQDARCPRFTIELAEKKEDFLSNYYLLIKLVIKVASNLLDQKNEAGWNYTKPGGFEGRKLVGILLKFYEQTSTTINNLVNKFLYTPREMCSLIQEKNIIVKLRASRWSDFRGTAFPDFDDLREIPEDLSGPNDRATIVLSEDFLPESNDTEVPMNPKLVVIVTALYRDAENRAVHSSHWNQRIKRTGSVVLLNQKINSEIISIAVSVDSKTIQRVRPHSLKIYFKFKEYQNISNPDCLFLDGDIRQGYVYASNRSTWAKTCIVTYLKVDSAVCECDKLGVGAIATDMFNDNWNKIKPPNELIALPSYIGCTVSALLGSVTLIMLVYLRTSSNTSAIHKHFSAAIIASQLSYMIGIDKYEHETLCYIFSLSLHYFFLSCFAWLMNEAFNLYIVITYAAHSHSDNIDGHMWRFYLLGWIMPGIVVAAIAGVTRGNYHAPDMCWINQNDLWLFCGPAIVVIAVTILVLIFTAKEQHESSYTKNEKDNKAVVNQTKAIWTQIILLPLSWSFAFLVLRMQGMIVKYLFGLFVSLQGSFYIMFYYLLNDEVQKIYSEKKMDSSERRRLEPADDAEQPYGGFNDSSSTYSRTRRSSRKDDDEVTSHKQKGFFTNVIENLNIRSKRSVIGEELSDTNNNENSDYELITTV